MISFRLKDHGIRNSQMVEILDEDGKLLGAIYPQEWGIRVISKYLFGRNVQLDSTSFPVALEVRLP